MWLIQRGRCVLFLGAGAHAPPPDGSRFAYAEANRPPSAAALSESLAASCGLAETYPDEDTKNLQRVALFYELRHSHDQLVDEVRRAVHVGRAPSPALRALAELDFPLVITTNYDHLFEDALRAIGKNPRVVASRARRARVPAKLPPGGEPTAESPIIFKIHGDIDEPKTMVLTDEDYVRTMSRFVDPDRNAVPLWIWDEMSSHPILIIGYSLSDLAVRWLLSMQRALLSGDVYSVNPRPDPLLYELARQGRGHTKFITQDMWTFVPSLYELVLAKAMPEYAP